MSSRAPQTFLPFAVAGLLVASAAPAEGAQPQRSGLNPEVIEQLTGAYGAFDEKEGGWAAFAGSDSSAVVDGDFAVMESELQPVLKALRKAGIDIVAILQHMTGEQPRVLFLHYWGTGRAVDLARGLRAALDRTGTRLGSR